MSDKMTKAPKTEKRDAFLKFIQELQPIEISWALNSLADHSVERIKHHRDTMLRVKNFGADPTSYDPNGKPGAVDETVTEAARWIEFHRKMITLAQLWREAKGEFDMPHIIAALTGKRPR